MKMNILMTLTGKKTMLKLLECSFSRKQTIHQHFVNIEAYSSSERAFKYCFILHTP